MREQSCLVTDQGGHPLDFEDEWKYLQDWIVRHMAYLDTHVFAPKQGDVNLDGEVGVADITALVAMVMGRETTTIAADVNGDGEMSAADISMLADIVRGQAGQ